MAWKIVLGVVLVIAVLLGAAGTWFYAHPLDALAWAGRRSLVSAGFARASWESPAGRQTGFVGDAGPLVVLLHGAGDQSGAWAEVAPKLAKGGRGERGRRVVVLDLAGHGESEPRKGPIHLQNMLDGLDAVLAKEAPVDGASLVGNSLGAWVAFLEAAARPGRVAQVVAINGGPLKGDNAAFTLQPKDREEARKTVAALRDPSSLAVPDFILDDIVRQARTGPLGRLAETAPEMERYLLDGRLAGFHVPVAIIWGESDRMLTLDYARRLQAELPGATLATIPGCGHAPPNECPLALVRVLDGVLDAKGTDAAPRAVGGSRP